MRVTLNIALCIFVFGLLPHNILSQPLEEQGQNSDDVKMLAYSEGEHILIPHIESCLLQLMDTTGTSIFNEVSLLNRFNSNRNYELALRELMAYYSSRNFTLSEEALSIQDEVLNSMASHNFLLYIRTKSIRDFVEYQVELFETATVLSKNSDAIGIFPSLQLKQPIRSINFIINLADNGIKSRINSELKKLFPETNSPPIANISCSHKAINSLCDSITIAIGETIKLDARKSYDVDTNLEELKFSWRQIGLDTENFDFNDVIPINRDSIEQQVRFSKAGIYRILLQVNDRINYSVMDTITIRVVRPPKIFLRNNYFSNSYDWVLFSRGQKYRIGRNRLHLSILNNNDTLSYSGLRFQRTSPVIDSLKTLNKRLYNKDAHSQEYRQRDSLSNLDYRNSGVAGSLKYDSLGFAISVFYENSLSFVDTFNVSYLSNGVLSNTEQFFVRNKVYHPISMETYVSASSIPEVDSIIDYRTSSFGFGVLFRCKITNTFFVGLAIEKPLDGLPSISPPREFLLGFMPHLTGKSTTFCLEFSLKKLQYQVPRIKGYMFSNYMSILTTRKDFVFRVGFGGGIVNENLLNEGGEKIGSRFAGHATARLGVIYKFRKRNVF